MASSRKSAVSPVGPVRHLLLSHFDIQTVYKSHRDRQAMPNIAHYRKNMQLGHEAETAGVGRVFVLLDTGGVSTAQIDLGGNKGQNGLNEEK